MAPKSAAKKKMMKKVIMAKYHVHIFLLRAEKKGDNSGIRLATIMGKRIMLIHRRSKRKPSKNDGTKFFHCSPSGLKASNVMSL